MSEMLSILTNTKYITIAMCQNDQPYLVTLSHGFDAENNCIYFHCAQEGKKIDILTSNNLVWGQAIEDHGYAEGACDHLYATVQFMGRVTFIGDIEEKERALRIMVHALEPEPEKVIQEQISEKSLQRVNIGRIDIGFMSGKKSKEIVVIL